MISVGLLITLKADTNGTLHITRMYNIMMNYITSLININVIFKYMYYTHQMVAITSRLNSIGTRHRLNVCLCLLYAETSVQLVRVSQSYLSSER